MTGTWGVMCCGCNRFMGVDGKPISKPASTVKADEVKWFETKQAADAAADANNWRAEKGNHRCPECIAEEQAREKLSTGTRARRGAYVNKAEFSRLSSRRA